MINRTILSLLAEQRKGARLLYCGPKDNGKNFTVSLHRGKEHGYFIVVTQHYLVADFVRSLNCKDILITPFHIYLKGYSSEKRIVSKHKYKENLWILLQKN